MRLLGLSKKTLFKGIKLYKPISLFIETFFFKKYFLIFKTFNLRLYLYTFFKKLKGVFLRKNFFYKYYKYRRVKRWVRRSYIRLEKRSNFFF